MQFNCSVRLAPFLEAGTLAQERKVSCSKSHSAQGVRSLSAQPATSPLLSIHLKNIFKEIYLFI